MFRTFIRDESGQDIVEYALLGALIGIAAILTWQQLAATVGVTYGTADAGVQGLSSLHAQPRRWCLPVLATIGNATARRVRPGRNENDNTFFAMPMTAVQIAAVALVLLASVGDIRTRRIPNVLTFGAALLALLVHGVTGGWSGVGQWSAGGYSEQPCSS